MLPLHVKRCEGCTSVRGRPFACCIDCQRRIWPEGADVVVKAFVVDIINRVPVCSGQIPYPSSSGAASAAIHPAGPQESAGVL